MEELDLSWADLGGTFSNAANEIVSGWAAGTAAKLRGTDGAAKQPTAANAYDQRVTVPNDGAAQQVADDISGTLSEMKPWVIGAFLLGVGAFIYSRS